MKRFGALALLFGATFVGISLGHSLIRGLFGTNHSRQEGSHSQAPAQANPCQYQMQNFSQCINYAHMDISKCQVYMDDLRSCQSQYGVQ